MSNEWMRNLDDQGRTPLDRAFSSGHRSLAETMMRQEKLDQQEALYGSTPLHRAAYLGLTPAVRSLIQYGADPQARDAHAETPLFKAVREGHYETVQYLLEYCNPNDTSSDGLTPMHWACIAGHADVAELLSRRGGDPWLRNEAIDGLTPMGMAEIMGHEDVYEVLNRGRAFV